MDIFAFLRCVKENTHRIRSQKTPKNVDILNDKVVKEITDIIQMKKGYIHNHEYALFLYTKHNNK